MFLKQTLNLSSNGGLTRFLIESLITPSLYSSLFRSKEWETKITSLIHSTPNSPSSTILKQIETNIRFRSAARHYYLLNNHYVPIDTYNKLVEEKLIITRSELFSMFPEMKNVTYLGDEDSKRRNLVIEGKRAKSGLDLKHWSIQDVLEACGCCIYGTSPFNLYCETVGIYDFFTSEYIQELAKQLKGKRFILEIGAGSGRLSHLLRQVINNDETTIIATDSGSWGRMKGLKASKYPVVKANYIQALNMFQPDVVICSWMPMNQDWTKEIRKKSSVMEYFLIGESDCCGKMFETYGIPPIKFDPTISFLNDEPKYDPWVFDVFELLSGAKLYDQPSYLNNNQTPFYEQDGWTKTELMDLRRLQVSRYDRKTRGGNSSTFKFSRT